MAVALLSCGGGGDMLINPVARSGSIVIEISRSTPPEFNWRDGLPVQAISVYNFTPAGEVDQVLWGYANISIRPPITYGARLSGGIDLTGGRPAPPLQPGLRYRVEVVRGNESSYADWIVP